MQWTELSRFFVSVCFAPPAAVEEDDPLDPIIMGPTIGDGSQERPWAIAGRALSSPPASPQNETLLGGRLVPRRVRTGARRVAVLAPFAPLDRRRLDIL